MRTLRIDNGGLPILHTHFEGTVPQILYLGLFFFLCQKTGIFLLNL